MAHDGQDMTQMTTPAILPDLLTLTRAAVPAVEAVFERARESVRDMVSADGKISGALIEANQTAAHGLAWLATYNQSLQQMQRYGCLASDSLSASQTSTMRPANMISTRSQNSATRFRS